MRTEDHTVPFLDEIVQALTDPKRAKNYLYGYKNTAEGNKLCRQTRYELFNAQKIVLSDSFVEQAVKSSYVRLPTFLNECSRAIPPFDNLWVEWDETVKDKNIEKHCPYEDHVKAVSPTWTEPVGRVGYHIKREKLGFFSYACWLKGDFNKDRIADGEDIFCSPVEVFLNLGDNIQPFKTLYGRENALKVICNILGFDYLHFNEVDLSVKNPNSPFILPDKTDFLDRFYTKESRANIWSYTKKERKTKLPKWSKDTAVEVDKKFGNCIHGAMRFLITVFSLMNYDFHYTQIEKNAVVRSTAPRMKHPHPMWEYKVVKLDLPKLKGITVKPPLFAGHGTPKRQHWRRGHWRNQQGIRKWIEPQLVGDAKNGTLIHDYELVS